MATTQTAKKMPGGGGATEHSRPTKSPISTGKQAGLQTESYEYYDGMSSSSKVVPPASGYLRAPVCCLECEAFWKALILEVDEKHTSRVPAGKASLMIMAKGASGNSVLQIKSTKQQVTKERRFLPGFSCSVLARQITANPIVVKRGYYQSPQKNKLPNPMPHVYKTNSTLLSQSAGLSSLPRKHDLQNIGYKPYGATPKYDVISTPRRHSHVPKRAVYPEPPPNFIQVPKSAVYPEPPPKFIQVPIPKRAVYPELPPNSIQVPKSAVYPEPAPNFIQAPKRAVYPEPPPPNFIQVPKGAVCPEPPPPNFIQVPKSSVHPKPHANFIQVPKSAVYPELPPNFIQVPKSAVYPELPPNFIQVPKSAVYPILSKPPPNFIQTRSHDHLHESQQRSEAKPVWQNLKPIRTRIDHQLSTPRRYTPMYSESFPTTHGIQQHTDSPFTTPATQFVEKAKPQQVLSYPATPRVLPRASKLVENILSPQITPSSRWRDTQNCRERYMTDSVGGKASHILREQGSVNGASRSPIHAHLIQAEYPNSGHNKLRNLSRTSTIESDYTNMSNPLSDSSSSSSQDLDGVSPGRSELDTKFQRPQDLLPCSDPGFNLSRRSTGTSSVVMEPMMLFTGHGCRSESDEDDDIVVTNPNYFKHIIKEPKCFKHIAKPLCPPPLPPPSGVKRS